MKQLPSGSQAPDFQLKTLAGQAFRLADALRNGPVVLAFYKASCPTCQFTFPYLQRIHSAGGTVSKAQIIAVSQDDANETREFIANFGIGFPVLIDEYPFDVSMLYGLEFVPGIFIVDRGGVVRLSDFGFSKASLMAIAQIIADEGNGSVAELFSPDDGIPATRPG
jgi:peroxiredoxin